MRNSRTLRNRRRAWIAVAVGLASLACGRFSLAAVTFDWATIGDVGNPADTRYMSKGAAPECVMQNGMFVDSAVNPCTTGYGSVDYTYQISKTHVTNAQYTEFLNAVDPTGFNDLEVYNVNMTMSTIGPTGAALTGGIDYDFFEPNGNKYSVKPGQDNFPATWINWDSSARFVNWLSNGQGSADTENGVYDMDYECGFGGCPSPSRQPGSTIFIPTEDEFYKAAYYDPTKNGTGGYWEYGLRSDTDPIDEPAPGGPTSANWNKGVSYLASPAVDINYLTEVGAYTNATSHYGLFDVDGLSYQWTEDGRKLAGPAGQEIEFVVYRGGAWSSTAEFTGASYRNLYSFASVVSYHQYGLRVAGLPTTVSIDGDFDNDGSYDCADIDALVLEIAAGTNDAAFDLTGDGAVTLADRDAWLVQGGAAELASGNAFLLGDVSLDGNVDSTDLGQLLNNFGATSGVAYCDGDLDADSSVDSTDLGLLLNKFGQSANSASAVPEPQSHTMLLTAFLLLTGRWRRRERN